MGNRMRVRARARARTYLRNVLIKVKLLKAIPDIGFDFDHSCSYRPEPKIFQLTYHAFIQRFFRAWARARTRARKGVRSLNEL